MVTSWGLIGLAYPLFYIFLPEYLASRGANFGESSAFLVWRDYVITNTLAIPGPMIAAALCRTKLLGRKYTMLIGGLVSSMDPNRLGHATLANVLLVTFLFAYTSVRNASQNLGFSCAISVAINVVCVNIPMPNSNFPVRLTPGSVLRYFICVHSGSAAFCTPRYWGWRIPGYQSIHGHRFGHHRKFCRHLKRYPSLPLRSIVRNHGIDLCPLPV